MQQQQLWRNGGPVVKSGTKKLFSNFFVTFVCVVLSVVSGFLCGLGFYVLCCAKKVCNV